MSFYRIFRKIYEQAAYRMCHDCEEFIDQKAKILDIGCGSAIIANTFQQFFDTEVIGVDVVDRRVHPIPFSRIDGHNLNFLDRTFDNVLIAFTLHHSQDPIALLKEAKRACKGKIFIYEDLPEGFLSRVFCNIHGFSFDNFFGNKSKTVFKTETEWKEVFRSLDLNLVFEKCISLKIDPVKKKLFVLEVAAE